MAQSKVNRQKEEVLLRLPLVKEAFIQTGCRGKHAANFPVKSSPFLENKPNEPFHEQSAKNSSFYLLFNLFP